MAVTNLNIRRSCLTALFFLTGIIRAGAQDITGIWLTANDESKIQIYKSGNGLYQGKLIWTKDQSEKAKKFHGSMILTNFKKEGETAYKGKVHDPRESKTYNCTITMKNKNDLDLRGYVGFSLLGRTEHWKRSID